MRGDIAEHLVLRSLTPTYPLAAKQLAAKTGLTSSNVRAALKRLKKKGFVDSNGPKDPFLLRENRWQLTEEGKKVRDRKPLDLADFN